MPGLVSIAYNLGEHGWSSFTLTIGAQSIEVGPFGYCTDALGDLVRAALTIATSGGRAEAAFDGEPREWLLIIERAHGEDCGPTDIRVAVTTWPCTEDNTERMQGLDHSAIVEQPASQGPNCKLVVVPVPLSSLPPPPEHITVFDAITPEDTFILSVLHCAQGIWDEHGSDGYDKIWGGPRGFPLRALIALKAAVSVQEPRTNWIPTDPNATSWFVQTPQQEQAIRDYFNKNFGPNSKYSATSHNCANATGGALNAAGLGGPANGLELPSDVESEAQSLPGAATQTLPQGSQVPSSYRSFNRPW